MSHEDNYNDRRDIDDGPVLDLAPGDDCEQNFPFSIDRNSGDRTPFGPSDYGASRVPMGRFDAISDNLARRSIDFVEMFRLRSASRIIACSMVCLVGFVIMNAVASYFGIEVKLLDNAFEAFKLIVMTAIGFLFGSKSDGSARNSE